MVKVLKMSSMLPMPTSFSSQAEPGKLVPRLSLGTSKGDLIDCAVLR